MTKTNAEYIKELKNEIESLKLDLDEEQDRRMDMEDEVDSLSYDWRNTTDDEEEEELEGRIGELEEEILYCSLEETRLESAIEELEDEIAKLEEEED